MPSPTQQFFDELAELSFADESYKQRFIEELHDHIEDAIHDADVRGVDDATAEKAAIQKLGSPKKLQKNFNRMMKPQRLQTFLLCALQCIGTFGITYAALIPFGGIADSVVNVIHYFTGEPYMLDYPNLSESILLLIVAIGFLGVIQVIIFQTALFSLLSQRMKRSSFWLIYIAMTTPAILTILILPAMALRGIPSEFWASQLSGVVLQYSITLIFILVFLTICFTLAAIGVIARLNSSSFFLQFVGYLPDSISRPITQLFTRYRIFSHLNTVNIFGVLSVLYLLFWLVASFVPSLQVFLQSGNQYLMDGTEPQIWWLIFVMPITVISGLQTITISALFVTLSPINGIWAAGLIYSGLLLLCIALIILSLRKQKIKTMQSFWVASCLALACIMVLTNRFPNDFWGTSNHRTQWERPAKNLSVKIDKKVFGPFYMLYNSTSLFTPIPASQVLVDTTGDFFVIQTALGSEFLLDSADSSKLTMTHRSAKDTIQNVEAQLATAIPEELQHRVYCGEKTLDKKGDIFSDGTPSYICQSIKIDNTLVASGGSIGLLDVAISPDNATALVVVTENGKPRVYQVNLK